MNTQEHQLTDTAKLNENCFWKLDLQNGNLYWSDALCLLLGLEKAKKPTFQQLMDYYGHEQNIRTAFKCAIFQGIPFQLELPAITANNKVVMICTTAISIYDDYGKCVAIKGTLEIEMQAENLAASFPNTIENKGLHQAMLDNFAKVVSHDLRSNTVNLQMLVESVQQKNICNEMQDFITHIKTISQNLNQTVGYLNTLTKI